MYNHSPENYLCPICSAARGTERDDILLKQSDIFYRDGLVMAFIGARSFDNIPGHVVIVPIEHYEHIYDLPADCNNLISELAQRVAVALKKIRSCDGITILQNNEPAGGQSTFHYHLHIFPRFKDDDLSRVKHSVAELPSSDRQPYADDLRRMLA